jgi:hypothetical protein
MARFFSSDYHEAGLGITNSGAVSILQGYLLISTSGFESAIFLLDLQPMPRTVKLYAACVCRHKTFFGTLNPWAESKTR